LLSSRYYPRTLDLAFSRRMITSAFFAGYSLRNRGDVISVGVYISLVILPHNHSYSEVEFSFSHITSSNMAADSNIFLIGTGRNYIITSTYSNEEYDMDFVTVEHRYCDKKLVFPANR